MRYLWLFCLSVSLWSQTFDLSHFQNGSTSLAGQWRFHPGDDPRWADPNFDDSDWKLVKVPAKLSEQGDPNFSGYGWYRVELDFGPMLVRNDLQLILGPTDAAYEVFANGIHLGQFGAFPPNSRIYEGRLMVFSLPRTPGSRGSRLRLAVRLWHDPRLARWSGGGIAGGPVEIGQAASINNLVAAHRYQELLGRLPGGMMKYFEVMLALALITIYFLDRRPE